MLDFACRTVAGSVTLYSASDATHPSKLGVDVAPPRYVVVPVDRLVLSVATVPPFATMDRPDADQLMPDRTALPVNVPLAGIVADKTVVPLVDDICVLELLLNSNPRLVELANKYLALSPEYSHFVVCAIADPALAFATVEAVLASLTTSATLVTLALVVGM